MMLPNRQSAFVPEAKLSEYLISETHAVGKAKAKFLRILGYDEDNLDLLADGLIKIPNTQEINQKISSKHGTKYVISGLLPTLVGKTVKIKTIWIINKDENVPRFITAYPN